MNKNDKIKHLRLLATYGITLEEFQIKSSEQNHRCFICGNKPKYLNQDHRHVKGYKKLSPEDKKKECRGLLCMRCNKFTVGGLEIHKNARQVFNNMINYFKLYKLKGDL